VTFYNTNPGNNTPIRMPAAAVQRPLIPTSVGSVNEVQLQAELGIAHKESYLKPHDVKTTLNYYKDPQDGSLPHPTYIDRLETYERPVETHHVTVHDVSGREDEYSLDANGFQFHRHVATEKDFLDDDQIKASYFPETEQLLKDVTGASRIFIFDHIIRRHSPTSSSRDRTAPGPFQRVHIDQSYTAALSRVSYHLPEDAEKLLKGRVQIINVWRPIKQVVRDPLAVAEAHSVPDTDLVPTALIYANRKGETYQVRHSASHKWYYKYGLTPEEVLFIKCFDSKTDGRARRVPHTAFVDPTTDDSLPARESIEVRALVFHPDDRD